MTRNHPALHGGTWQQLYPLPRLDVQTDHRMLPEGFCSRLSGVDGRWAGGLRTFPGFKKTGVYADAVIAPDVPAYNFGALNGFTLLEPFAVQQGPGTSKIIRGYVFLANDGSTDRLYVVFTDDLGAIYSGRLLTDFGGAVNYIDITYDTQLIHIVGELAATGAAPVQKIEKVARYCGSVASWKAVDWSTTAPIIATAPTVHRSGHPTTDVELIQSNSNLGLAYRFVYPDQGWFGPLTPVAQVSAGSGGSGLRFLTLTVPAPSNGDVFTRCVVQLFRSVGSRSTVEGGGKLFLESEQEVPRYTSTYRATSGTLVSDTVITLASLASNINVGDVLYIRPQGGTAGEFGTYDRNANEIVFRRTVTGKSGSDITFTPAVNRENGLGTPGVITGAAAWVSKISDESDTSGTFSFSDGSTTSFLRWGWNPGVPSVTPKVLPLPDCPVGLRDDALVLQPALTPEDFGTLPKGNPVTRLIENYDGLTIRVTSISRREGVYEHDVIRWDRPDLDRRGLVHVRDRRAVADLSDSVLNLINGDTFCAVVSQKSIIRIHRDGTRLAVDVTHNRYGAGGRQGMITIGNNLYMTSPVGVLVVDLVSGQLDVVGATQRFFDDSAYWGNDIASVQAAYDADCGTLIFFNPVKAEALFIWLNHGVLTHLTDIPFEHVRTFPDLQVGGRFRALWFFTTTAVGVSGNSRAVYELDALRAETTRSTMGSPSGSDLALNGIANTGTNSTTLKVPAGKAFSSDMTGHFVSFYNPTTGAFKVRVRVTSTNSTTLTFATASPAPAVGDRFAVGALPLRLTGWPLFADADQPLIDLIRTKKTLAMCAVVGSLSGDDDPAENPNLVHRYQLFGRDRTTALLEAEGVISATTNAGSFQGMQAGGSVLRPGLEINSSDLDLVLLGLIVRGTIEGTKQDAMP